MADVVNFKFGADSTGAMNALNAVKDGVQGIGSGFGAIKLDSLLSVAGQLRDMLTQAWQGIVAPAAEFEDYRVGFEVILGSAEAARDMVQQLSEFAAKTPMDMGEISKAANTLLAYGLSSSDAMERLRQLGDIAAVTKSSLADLARVYGKVATVGTMDTVAVDQFSERGINVRTALAERDGISVAQVNKNIAGKQYGKDDLDYVLESATGEGGAFFEGAAKAAGTFNGVLSSLADNFQMLRAEIGEGFLEPLKGAMAQLGEQLPQIAEQLRPAVEMAVNMVTWLIGQLPVLVRWAKNLVIALVGMMVMQKMVGIARAMLVTFRSLQAVMLGLGASVKKFGLGLGVARTVGMGLLTVFKAIGKVGWLLLITTAVEALSALYDKFFSDDEEAPAEEDHEQNAIRDAQAEELEEQRREARADEESARERIAALEQKLANAGNTEEFVEAERALVEEMKRLRSAYLNTEGGDRQTLDARYNAWKKAEEALEASEALRAEALRRERDAEARERSRKMLDNYWDATAKRDTEGLRARFAGMTADKQATMLAHWLTHEAGVQTVADQRSIASGLDAAEHLAAMEGNETLAENVTMWRSMFADMQKNAQKEAEKAAENKSSLDAFARRELAQEMRERGLDEGLERMQREEEAVALAEELRGYGLSKEDADARAAAYVAREAALAESGEQRGELIADSMAAIGGGGNAVQLGNAQLNVARQSLDVQQQQRELLEAIRLRLDGQNAIPVVP